MAMNGIGIAAFAAAIMMCIACASAFLPEIPSLEGIQEELSENGIDVKINATQVGSVLTNTASTAINATKDGINNSSDSINTTLDVANGVAKNISSTAKDAGREGVSEFLERKGINKPLADIIADKVVG